ncbi:MAG: hypothetical protein WBL99_15070 [Candidatus Acidiferrales bacterium]
MPKDAGTRAAVHFLELIETKNTKLLRGGPGSADRLKSLLQIDDYRKLFDRKIAGRGDWTYLLQILPPKKFNNEVKMYQKYAETVVDIMDFRFRCLEHHSDKGGDFSNLTHGYVYRYKDPDKSRELSGSTIENHWHRQQDSAVFVYVAKRADFKFFPCDVGAKEFVEHLIQAARDKAGLQKYFGMCAYVAEKFGNDFSWLIECFPTAKALPRIRLKTEPLSADDFERFKNYRDDASEFKNN